jgi:hypothetical protein
MVTLQGSRSTTEQHFDRDVSTCTDRALCWTIYIAQGVVVVVIRLACRSHLHSWRGFHFATSSNKFLEALVFMYRAHT